MRLIPFCLLATLGASVCCGLAEVYLEKRAAMVVALAVGITLTFGAYWAVKGVR